MYFIIHVFSTSTSLFYIKHFFASSLAVIVLGRSSELITAWHHVLRHSSSRPWIDTWPFFAQMGLYITSQEMVYSLSTRCSWWGKKKVFAAKIYCQYCPLWGYLHIFWFRNVVSVSSISLSNCWISEKSLDLHEWGQEEESTAATRQ